MEITVSFTKPQTAYASYYLLMHDMWRSYGPEAHPSWKEAFQKQCAQLEELIHSMNADEKADLIKMLQPHKPLIPFVSRALKEIK